MPHVRVRQVLGSPTTAKALTPAAQAPERDRKTAAHHLRDLLAYVRLRARELRGHRTRHRPAARRPEGGDRRAACRRPAAPRRCRPLQRPERSRPLGRRRRPDRARPDPAGAGDRRGALRRPHRAGAGRATEPGLVVRHRGAAHPPRRRQNPRRAGRGACRPTAEAIRWSICEAELIQAMGRGRGVNRTAETPLQIDLMTDVVLPVTVDELIAWPDLCPTRRDLMAARGWCSRTRPTWRPASRTSGRPRRGQEGSARGVGQTGYHRILYNSEMSHSSVVVSYRPEGPGQSRVARSSIFDLTRDPEAWLTSRLGPLAVFSLDLPARPVVSDADRLADLTRRLHAAMARDLAARNAALDALGARLGDAAPASPCPAPDLFPSNQRRRF